MWGSRVDNENLGNKWPCECLPRTADPYFLTLYQRRELHFILNYIYATRPGFRGEMGSTTLAARIDCVPGYAGRTEELLYSHAVIISGTVAMTLLYIRPRSILVVQV